MHTSVDLSGAQKLLLASGILASVLKVGSDLLAGMTWKGYSFVSQSISELSAAGAPTRSLVLPLELMFDVLVMAFAVGVWQLAGESLLMRIVSALIVGNAAISLFVSLFLPMRISPDGGSSASTIHVLLMAIGVLCFLLAMGMAGAAYGDWFRYVSLGILAAYLVLAIARFLLPSPTIGGPPVATVGVQERTMVVGYLLWLVALAIHQLASTSV
jgi:hypothetical protein